MKAYIKRRLGLTLSEPEARALPAEQTEAEREDEALLGSWQSRQR